MAGLRQVGCLMAAMALAACSNSDAGGTATYAGSCSIVSTESPDVQSCIEFGSLSDEQAKEAEASCNSQESKVSKTWKTSQACSSLNRIGKCLLSTNNLSSTRWAYSTGKSERDSEVLASAEELCTSEGGVWSAIR